MAHYDSFEKLDVFKNATLFCDKIWELINQTPLKNDYKLREQINASSGSIMDNIAEGFGRGGNKEFIMFLSYAKGSCCESKSQLIRCFRRNHLSKEQFEDLSNNADLLNLQLSKFITYLMNSERKGPKYDNKK